jgi:uncharacterized protein with von Willebrand factor type A (vWA) domain
MYPFASLPENLAAFCRDLRRAHGFLAGTHEMLDAARALTSADLGDERKVRDALRPILSSSFSEARRFDAAFAAFFLSRGVRQEEHATALQRPSSTRDVNSAPAREASTSGTHEPGDHEGDLSTADAASAEAVPDPRDAADGDRATGLLRSRYSPIDVDSALGPQVGPVEAEWREAARSLVRRIHLGVSRRWRPGKRGRRFDLRRTLRASLQTGGDPVSRRWLHRTPRRPRFVLLVDGSRSMTAYWQPSLELAVAMAAATARLEVFVFSTTVERVTGDVRSAAAGDRTRLAGLRTAWGGGTSIGSAIGALVQRSGKRLLGRDTVVIIVSDGLDVGRPETLRDAMRELQRRSAGVVWLNPLAGTPGYQPTAGAMRAARPFVSTFACVTTAEELGRLSSIVRVWKRFRA